MMWLYGFALFGAVCAIVITAAVILFVIQVSRDGWNN